MDKKYRSKVMRLPRIKFEFLQKRLLIHWSKRLQQLSFNPSQRKFLGKLYGNLNVLLSVGSIFDHFIILPGHVFF